VGASLNLFGNAGQAGEKKTEDKVENVIKPDA
jgi:hypothetical protein